MLSVASAASFRFNAPDLRIRPLQFDCGCDAAKQPAAADGGQHEIDLGQVFENFEAASSLPGDNGRVVIRLDDRVAVECSQLLGALFALQAGGADGDDLRTECFRCLSLDRGGIRRHDDHGPRAEYAGGVGDALGMIAARIGDESALESFPGERRGFVIRAAQLETADRLHGFGLEINASAVGEVRSDHRSTAGYPLEPVLGISQFGKRDQGAAQLRAVAVLIFYQHNFSRVFLRMLRALDR